MVTIRVATGQDDPIDVHIGRRLRLAREAAGVSQPELGDALDRANQLRSALENELGSR